LLSNSSSSSGCDACEALLATAAAADPNEDEEDDNVDTMDIDQPLQEEEQDEEEDDDVEAASKKKRKQKRPLSQMQQMEKAFKFVQSDEREKGLFRLIKGSSALQSPLMLDRVLMNLHVRNKNAASLSSRRSDLPLIVDVFCLSNGDSVLPRGLNRQKLFSERARGEQGIADLDLVALDLLQQKKQGLQEDASDDEANEEKTKKPSSSASSSSHLCTDAVCRNAMLTLRTLVPVLKGMVTDDEWSDQVRKPVVCISVHYLVLFLTRTLVLTPT
jgi:hypothetical protein